ncbi:hypothetical protein LCGC14_1967870 [marine sediment metagenome]|uniref:Uncharacterized protein n=1 Tax=marine sediment metagenome TaxID=412755 RepID=A0A0F9FCZ2_9ZZZZ
MNYLNKAKEAIKEDYCDAPPDYSAAKAHALIAIAEELQKLNDTLEYINGKLTVPPKELK